MTTNQQAFKKAQEELQQEKVDEIKGLIKSILQKIEDQKKKKAEAEDAIRVLKLDLEDMKNGNIYKIKKRHESSANVRSISPLTDTFLNTAQSWVTYTTGAEATNALSITNAVSGSYTVNSLNGTKEYYL